MAEPASLGPGLGGTWMAKEKMEQTEQKKNCLQFFQRTAHSTSVTPHFLTDGFKLDFNAVSRWTHHKIVTSFFLFFAK